MVIDQEKPIATPGHISFHPAQSGHIQDHILGLTVAGHIGDGDCCLIMQLRCHCAEAGFDPMLSRLETSDMSQGNGEANGAVTAHFEQADIVKEYDSSDAG